MRLTARAQLGALLLMSDALVPSGQRILPVSAQSGYRVGLYVGLRPEAAGWRVVYVGQVDRRPCLGDMADRYRRHAQRFPAVWVLPVAASTPSDVLNDLEGRLGRYFGRPQLNRRLPKVGGAL